MSEPNAGRARRVLAFTTIVELGVGLALLLDPSLVATLFFGVRISGVETAFARCFGIALVALGVACWPGRPGSATAASAVQAMLIYNALVALYVTYLGTAGGLGGLLLWPAVGLHAVVALLLLYTGRALASRSPGA